MGNLDDFSLMLTKAYKAGFFEDVKPHEEAWLKQEAKKLFGNDLNIPPRGDMFLGVATALKQPSVSFGIQATGDSTTTPDFAWFRQLANEVSSAYPVLTHHYRKWNDTTQDLDRPIVLNSGSAGRLAFKAVNNATRVAVVFDGTTNINGDIDIRVNLKSPNWASGATQSIATKWTNDSNLSWAFHLNATGTLRFQWSSDGTLTWAGDRTSTVAVPFSSNTEGWVRVTLDVDNGASGHDVKFYTSSDGASWTQLGTTITTAGVTSIFSSISNYTLGARGASSGMIADTEIYEVQIRDGINGGSVVPYFPDMWEKGIGTGQPDIIGSPICTWVMSGQPGAGIGYDSQVIGYLADPTRMKKMSPHFNQLVYFFNSSHNEYFLQGNLWAKKYSAWVNAISSKNPLAARIALTQNPRTGTPGTDPGPKARRSHMLAWARQTPGMDVIDTYQAFLDDGRDLNTVLISDTVHPTTAGYTLWKDVIKFELDSALSRVTSY